MKIECDRDDRAFIFHPEKHGVARITSPRLSFVPTTTPQALHVDAEGLALLNLELGNFLWSRPSLLDTARRIEQIAKALIVYLEVGADHHELLLALSRLLSNAVEERRANARDDSLIVLVARVARHRPRFARSRLPVRKDRAVESVERRVEHGLPDVAVDVVLARILVVGEVELERPVLGLVCVRGAQQVELAVHANFHHVVVLELALARSAALAHGHQDGRSGLFVGHLSSPAGVL